MLSSLLLALPALSGPTPTPSTIADCSPLRVGTAQAPSPNTPEAFAAYAFYNETAHAAVHPRHYERFLVGGQAALRDEGAYVTYSELAAYDVDACAAKCDVEKGCASFNIYFQRLPLYAPGPACPNPDPTVVVRCALFSQPQRVQHATNEGQLRGPADEAGETFEVLVAGSNGYNRLVSPDEVATVTRVVTVVPTETVTEVSTVTETRWLA